MEVDQIDIGELAERVFILKPSATRTVKNLQRRNLVNRYKSARDQRRAYISLTPEARDLFDRLAPKNEAEYSRITSVIGEGDMQELYELLRRVTDRLNGSGRGA
jgi:DNA-binding MarR family transcriptional regulator